MKCILKPLEEKTVKFYAICQRNGHYCNTIPYECNSFTVSVSSDKCDFIYILK